MFIMNDFNLPIIKMDDNPKRILSMDEYLEFVQFNLKNTLDKKAYAKWKKIITVNETFSLN